ncbi:MAG: hypothetical protein HQL51_00325 [Magnetococcales bacterium]|nr:hypothetical protein [Magnetococcales bacterium]
MNSFSPRGRREVLRAAAGVALLTLLGGCAREEEASLDPALLADDGWKERWQRWWKPELYWETKTAQWRLIFEEDREKFHASLNAYRQWMAQRREAMQRAERAEKNDDLKKRARQSASEPFRAEIKRLMEENKRLRERMRHDMDLLQQAEEQWIKARK